jgi:hypothetical protein
MKPLVQIVGVLSLGAAVSITGARMPAIGADSKSPADGYDIHVQAPHMMHDGTVGGPFHHYCKGISDHILQCLLFESPAPNARLVAVEYFVAKELSRKLPLIQWHRYFHDHKVESATGRVQVLEPADKAKEIADAASKTDGVIYHPLAERPGLPRRDGHLSPIARPGVHALGFASARDAGSLGWLVSEAWLLALPPSVVSSAVAEVCRPRIAHKSARGRSGSSEPTSCHFRCSGVST